MLRAAAAVRRQKLRGGWRWAVILRCDPWQSWKHRKPRVNAALAHKVMDHIFWHFLRAARTTLDGLTAHIGTVEKLILPENAVSETASRWFVHPGWESGTFRQQRGNFQPSEERFTFLPGTSWSLQKDGMFSMTEGISWFSPGASEHRVHCRNPV